MQREEEYADKFGSVCYLGDSVWDVIDSRGLE